MIKIFKNLWTEKKTVLAIVLLLIVQAYCDLMLPNYTSDIVDVGIMQKGIEHVSPDAMSEENYDRFYKMLLYTAEESSQKLFSDNYVLLEESYDYDSTARVYRLNEYGKENREKLDDVLFSGMMTAVSAMDGTQSGAQSTEMSESVVLQQAYLLAAQEHERAGIDAQEYQMNYLLKTGAVMLLYAIVGMAAAIAIGYLSARCGARIGRRLRKQVFHKVVSYSNHEMNHFSTASLITRSTNDIQQVQMVSIMFLRMVLYAPIVGIGGIVMVAQTRTGLGWIIVVAVIAILCLIGSLVAVANPKFKIMQTLVDKLNLVSREVLTGLSVIRAFSREEYEEKRFAGANEELMKTQLFTGRVMNFMMPGMMLIMNAISVAIVWFGAKGVDLGNLQVGDLMAFITYTMMIVMSFLMITMMSIMLPRAGVAAGRIEEVMKMDSSILDKQQPVVVSAKDAKGVLSFHDVAFRYDGADENALEHISFTAEPGKTTAIIGSTGCGKSTLLHLIPRFYDVTEGSVTIDGVDVRDMELKSLREMIGFVPQKGVLFSGTIASNLKFAGEQITDAQMQEAAQIACATEFIEEKTEGYESPIAQGGSNVSGGQKQRLSIARAIAKQPKIYLFDDSFSALDYKTDALLRRALKEKTKDATVLIVAQRISTILHADRILVLEDGKIVGMGTHEELLDSCEAYAEIAGSQLSKSELKGGALA
ncbi:MAG: ABC transporter ATP-binding protein [Lachnospiraceae bacterium]|nr:ABC transporter ATP-binding protein [Lachnospiraceae bacterium]